MNAARNLIAILCVTVGLVGGCHREDEIEQTMADEWASRQHIRPLYASMVDNAVMSDMSLAEIHFIPHQPDLGSTGMHRLDRMVPVLNTYGGTIRYQSNTADAQLVQARLASVRQYLSDAGCTMNDVNFVVDLPGGLGIPASDVVAPASVSTEVLPPPMSES